MPVTAGFDLNADKKDKRYFRGDGKPTSWSAGIDNLALGNYGAEDTDSRLIIISAGNTECYEIEEVDDYKADCSNTFCRRSCPVLERFNCRCFYRQIWNS